MLLSLNIIIPIKTLLEILLINRPSSSIFLNVGHQNLLPVFVNRKWLLSERHAWHMEINFEYVFDAFNDLYLSLHLSLIKICSNYISWLALWQEQMESIWTRHLPQDINFFLKSINPVTCDGFELLRNIKDSPLNYYLRFWISHGRSSNLCCNVAAVHWTIIFKKSFLMMNFLVGHAMRNAIWQKFHL